MEEQKHDADELANEDDDLAGGRAVIRSYVDELPHSAGVYRMLDKKGTPLYIGKAKSLKNRVSSYVNTGALNNRLQRMISQVNSLEFTTTRSEAEALLLEANLIKKHSPRYNVLLKDDKTFPYILFSGDHEFPRISKYRGSRKEKGKYYGPFVSASAVDEALTTLQRTFNLRSCSDNIFKNRTRPCLQYQIKRCCAPCVGYVSEEDYAILVHWAQDFLSGKTRQIQDELVMQMQEASSAMNYEKAAVLRDRIRLLTQIQQQGRLAVSGVEEVDVFALARDGTDVCVQILSIRSGQNYGSKNFFPSGVYDLADGEVVFNVIAQFYEAQPVPSMIFTSVELEDRELLEEALKTDIMTPKRGGKHEIVAQVMESASLALLRHINSRSSQKESLLGVRELFNLSAVPKRIEVYDNSHIMGTNQVGAMIVAGELGFLKKEYRKFNIENTNKYGASGGDDYAMLREVLTRRFRRIKDAPENKPDLVLIDGGVGQVGVARQVFLELGIDEIVFVGIAKGEDRNAGREWFFVQGRSPFQLPENDRTLHYLQRLRDEAHRFAIGAHRDKRSKNMQVSELDQIAGIGAARKKSLLLHFGSVRSIASASVDDISKVGGISKELADKIYMHFHG